MFHHMYVTMLYVDGTLLRGVRAFDTRATESSLSYRNTSSLPPVADNTRVSLRGNEAKS